MTSTDEKRVTQFVVALPGPHNETERATPCSVPRRPPRAVKAATRRSRDGLRPAWTAECCARVSGHPIFLSEKMGILQLEFRARFRAHDRHSCLYRWIGRAGYRSHRARDDACRRVHGPAPLLRDGLRVPVIELALGVGMDAAVRAVVLIGLYLAIGALPSKVSDLLRRERLFYWRPVLFVWLVRRRRAMGESRRCLPRHLSVRQDR